LVVAQQWNEQSISEVSGSFWQACALQAAVKLDVFSLLGRDGKTARDAAEKTSSDLRAMTSLLNALAAMGLLRKFGDRFSNTEPSSALLDRNSPRYLGWRILHHHYLMPSWARLDEAVQTGKPVGNEITAIDQESQREAFLMAMFNNALPVSGRIVPFIELEGRRNLLDLGGGPGTYAIEFCKKNPKLKAVVFDLPASRPYAEATIEKSDVRDRIDFSGGNFFEDEIPGSYDVVWMSHILHSSGPEACQLLIEKAVDVLLPGGLILIHDFWLNESGDGPLFPALFALNMLVRTDQGRSYTEAEANEMLKSAGLKNIRRLELNLPNDSGVFAGDK
jgi:SAM-dependent methyltransferase